jgi:hypothetical protein
MLRARSGQRSVRLVGRIAAEPQTMALAGGNYMIFRLEETGAKEFRLRILPTTPKRRGGDRVELTYQEDTDGIAWVEALTAAPDAQAVRRRNQEYLASIEARQAAEATTEG